MADALYVAYTDQVDIVSSGGISASGDVYGDDLYSDLLRRSSDNSTKVKLKLW